MAAITPITTPYPEPLVEPVVAPVLERLVVVVAWWVVVELCPVVVVAVAGAVVVVVGRTIDSIEIEVPELQSTLAPPTVCHVFPTTCRFNAG